MSFFFSLTFCFPVEFFLSQHLFWPQPNLMCSFHLRISAILHTVSAIKANSICFDVPTCHVQNLPFLYCFRDFGEFFKLLTPWSG